MKLNPFTPSMADRQSRESCNAPPSIEYSRLGAQRMESIVFFLEAAPLLSLCSVDWNAAKPVHVTVDEPRERQDLLLSRGALEPHQAFVQILGNSLAK